MTTTTTFPVLVDEHAAAAALGMSVFWLRKDRSTTRIVPWVKLGTRVRLATSPAATSRSLRASRAAPERIVTARRDVASTGAQLEAEQARAARIAASLDVVGHAVAAWWAAQCTASAALDQVVERANPIA